jgi:uncharacterized protein
VSIAFPYSLDASGSTRTATGDPHVVQMLEQLLFTSPGERVDRPDFGCGLLDLVFEPDAPALTTGLTAVITAAIHQWLGDVITVDDVSVTAADSRLSVTISFAVLPATRTVEVTFVAPETP